MRALTLIQPWAHAVVALGKRVENRTWCPPASLLGQRFAIHAGKRRVGPVVVRGECMDCSDEHCMIHYDGDAYGAVVGVATLLGWRDRRCCVGFGTSSSWDVAHNRTVLELDSDPWWLGPVGWLLGDVVRLAEPVPCRGAQGLWTLPDSVEAEVAAQCRAASDGKDGEG